MRGVLVGFILLLVAALAGLMLWQPEPSNVSSTSLIAEAPKGGDFELESYKGPVKLSDFKGKVVAIYFGYTWCPDVCPTSLGYLTAALDHLPDKKIADYQGLFISVDPERDSVERLKDYAEYFHPKLLGVTGSDEALQQIAKQYGAAYRIVKQDDSKMGYAVDHSADLYLIDKSGALAKTITHGAPPKEILDALQQLLN